MPVFKLQRPISSSAAAPPILACDKARKTQYLLPATEDLLDFFGTDMQVYAECQVAGDELRVIKRVELQDW